jgi:hypothetical protein
MKELKFTLKKQTTFFYGACTEDKLSDMISDAEDEGCELVQVMAGIMTPPQSPLAMPGVKPQPIQVMRILVRMPVDEYNKLIKSRKPLNGKDVH